MNPSRVCLSGQVCLLSVMASGPVLSAQSSQPLEFEVASIRQNLTRGPGQSRVVGGQLTITNAPIREVVRLAYRLSPHRMVEGQPLLDSHIDIVAKIPGEHVGTVTMTRGVPEMLQALLVDRFRLSTHVEAREMSVYRLSLARADGKLGPRLQEERTVDCDAARAAAAGELATYAQQLEAALRAELEGRGPGSPPDPRPICGTASGPNGIAAHSISMQRFADYTLTTLLRRPVLDSTGLRSTYSFALTFSRNDPMIAPTSAPNSVPDGRPFLAKALEDQLGLKLTSARGPVEVLVVDRVEMPTND